MGLLSLGVNSVHQLEAMQPGTESDSTRPGTTVASQLSCFKMKEGASEKKHFNTFYTTYRTAEEDEDAVKVKFERVNKFAGKSSFLSYVPTGKTAKSHIDERTMESAWNAH